MPGHRRLFDICCREEGWRCLRLVRGSSRMPSCDACTSFLPGRMSDQNYLASLCGGSIISPAGRKKQFLPLDSGAREEKTSRDLIVPVSRPAVTYLQAEPIYIRTPTPLVCCFLSWFRLPLLYVNCNVHRFGPMTFQCWVVWPTAYCCHTRGVARGQEERQSFASSVAIL